MTSRLRIVLAAAPPAAELAKLVDGATLEKVARASCHPLAKHSECEGPECLCWERQVLEARAAIAAFIEAVNAS